MFLCKLFTSIERLSKESFINSPREALAIQLAHRWISATLVQVLFWTSVALTIYSLYINKIFESPIGMTLRAGTYPDMPS